MIGYNLYLVDNHPDFPEHLYEEDLEPLFLQLSYEDLDLAIKAKEKLEEVYGEGNIEIDIKNNDLDHASQIYYRE